MGYVNNSLFAELGRQSKKQKDGRKKLNALMDRLDESQASCLHPVEDHSPYMDSAGDQTGIRCGRCSKYLTGRKVFRVIVATATCADVASDSILLHSLAAIVTINALHEALLRAMRLNPDAATVAAALCKRIEELQQ